MDAPVYPDGRLDRAAPTDKRAVVARLRNNALLRSLSHEECDRLRPFGRAQAFLRSTVLWQPGTPTQTVYFPISGVLSLTSATSDGFEIEIACIGREGASGISEADSQTTGTVLIGGTFLALPRALLERLRSAVSEFEAACWRWHEQTLAHARRTAACNTVHRAEQRFCRWLLQVADRSDLEISATQGEIANRLGLRRTTVTLFSHQMQLDGIISSRRGSIVILNRQLLEMRACQCYDRIEPLLLDEDRSNYGIERASA